MKSPVEAIVDIIVRVADPDRIILFGSQATGSSDRESDYDICVVKTGITHRRRCAMSLYESLRGIGVPVDIIVETPESLAEFASNPYFVHAAIERDGKVIYERKVTC
jgi:uncharacterized protein